VRLTGERGFVLTSAAERITAFGANGTQRVNIRTPSAQRPSPHFRLERHTITPAPRYTLEGDEVVVKPPENAAPIPAIRLVFIGADQERVYLLIPTARSD
ncbi:MAG: hypothetical protein NZM28_08260, partial [Fimbriimonadales bacterium]|nr:hypothetical protein [Fimbriimonadales bacterium]